MNNRFNLNEEEKNQIRGLHNINEDAGMDTPGGNPDYFYGGGQLQKLRDMNQDEVSELSTEEIVKILWQIQNLLSEGAPAIALRRVTELLGKMGEDIELEDGEYTTIEESKQPIKEQAHKQYRVEGDKNSPATAGQLETATNLMLTEMHENYMSDRNILLYLTRLGKESEGKTM